MAVSAAAVSRAFERSTACPMASTRLAVVEEALARSTDCALTILVAVVGWRGLDLSMADANAVTLAMEDDLATLRSTTAATTVVEPVVGCLGMALLTEFPSTMRVPTASSAPAPLLVDAEKVVTSAAASWVPDARSVDSPVMVAEMTFPSAVARPAVREVDAPRTTTVLVVWARPPAICSAWV